MMKLLPIVSLLWLYLMGELAAAPLRLSSKAGCRNGDAIEARAPSTALLTAVTN